MEWNTSSGNIVRSAFEEKQQQQQQEGGGDEMMVVEGLYVKVMTDEQMELLRKQIAVYAMICEQLVDMHKSLSSQYDISGLRLGNTYLDPLMACGVQKMTSRQRWSPTPMQLQILEQVYEECNGNPGKQKIQEMANELARHGQISETNVYNWFQNRRARIKRKQTGVDPSPNTDTTTTTTIFTESDQAEKIVQSKKTTLESLQSFENPPSKTETVNLQSPDIGMEQMIAKMDAAEIFSPQWQLDRLDFFG